MPEDARSKAERFREDARKLRAVAQEMRFVDLRRRQQLLALADGFDQSAARIEEQSLPKAAD